MSDNATHISVGGRRIRTLRDILPDRGHLRILFVAKTPAPISVEAGHYFQGRQGRMFWNRLMDYGLLRPTTPYEDDSLLAHGYGITDIVKVPRGFGHEPSAEEYAAGVDRLFDLIRQYRPSVVVFVYKRVLDEVLSIRFGVTRKSTYGFNPDFTRYFGSPVFAFPLPGTPCTAEQADAAMCELATVVKPKLVSAAPRSDAADEAARIRSDPRVPRHG